ncbi:MAG: hypothetical protein R2828_26045 [Saprospiraceae bacterium]
MPQQPLSGDWLNLHKDGMDYTVFRPTYPVNIFVDHYMVAKGQPTFSEERLFPRFDLFSANLRPGRYYGTGILLGSSTVTKRKSASSGCWPHLPDLHVSGFSDDDPDRFAFLFYRRFQTGVDPGLSIFCHPLCHDPSFLFHSKKVHTLTQVLIISLAYILRIYLGRRMLHQIAARQPNKISRVS